VVLLFSRSLDLPAATPEQMQWWRDARFGMFIHWDMSSLAGTEISWSRKGSKPLDISGDPAGYVEDPAYDHLYKRFNPTHFDAKRWVKLAQAAGMKYIVFTAKHHGGFCMWDTKLTGYSILHAPFQRDVVQELAHACHAAGMRFGLYYSPRDWHQPDYGISDNRKYVDYMNGQLRELLTDYGKVDILWFDSYGTGELVSFWRIGETFDLVQSLQPGILINNRLAVLGNYNQQPAPYRGEFDTPEQRVGAFQNTRPWESCMSLVTAEGGGWSYRPDGKVKPFRECVQTLINCVTGDGNLLLDVGPNSLGEIPADQAGRLLEMGQWLRKYGVSIYRTRGGPYRNGAWGGATYRGNTMYLHVFKWDGSQLRLPLLKSKILKCRLTGRSRGGGVKCSQTTDAITFTLPVGKQDMIDTIVELQLDGPAATEFVDGEAIATPTAK
jgi:alpha-L-fucosidase